MAFDTEQAPGVQRQAPAEARGFTLNHTMLRIKDPERALAFYTGVLGLRLLRRLDFPEMTFSLFFLSHPADGAPPPEDEGERTAYTFGRPGVLELTHNWGDEKDPEVRFHSGNEPPKGFGHIGIAVPDLDAATAWLDRNNVDWVKRPEDGKMNNIAFIRDPDGYWIEIFEPARMKDVGRG